MNTNFSREVVFADDAAMGRGCPGAILSKGLLPLARLFLLWDMYLEAVRGDTRRHLPWNHAQWGSNTSFTMTRTADRFVFD